MCGIVYVRRADGKPAKKTVLKRYSKQEDRGTEGFGYVSIEGGRVSEHKRYQSEAGVRKGLAECNASEILFHHRFPTSTINVPDAAHPILVEHKELKHSYYVVHNGVISNPDELRVQHVKQGYKYTTDILTQYKTARGKLYNGEVQYNDSEALAIELARTLEGLQEAVRARGSIAYIVMQVERASKKLEAVYYGTNGGNPLTISTGGALVIASEGGIRIPDNVCHRLDNEGTATVPLEMPVYYTATTYAAGYHYAYDKDEEEYIPKSIGETLSGYDDENDLRELSLQREELLQSIAIAKQCGETDEQLELEIELEAIEEEIAYYTNTLLGIA
jgi:predicted glutamine amidotransferase